MGISIGELFIDLGFDVDDKKLKEFNESIKAGAGELLKMSAIATGAVYALNAFMESSGQKAVSLRQFTLETGFAADALQKWQNLIHLTNPNVGVEEAANNYKKLAQTLIDIRQGKGNAGALAMLGVTYDTNLTPEKALDQISEHLQQTIAQNGIGFTTDKLNAIGIGSGAINALMMSAQQRDRLAAPFNISQDDINKLVEYERQMAALELEWNKFKATVSADWAPGLVQGINSASQGFHEFYLNLKAFIEFMSQYKEQIEFVAASFAPLLALLAIAEFPITAAITAVAFAINEMGKAIRGLPTVTGTFFDDAIHGNFKWAKDFADWAAPVNGPNVLQRADNWAYGVNHSGQKSPVTMYSNPVINVHTTASARDTAAEAARLLQHQNNSAYQQLNQGPSH